MKKEKNTEVAAVESKFKEYINTFPKQYQKKVAESIEHAKKLGSLCCFECGLPFGMPGVTARSFKIKNAEGKIIKIHLCPACLSAIANKK